MNIFTTRRAGAKDVARLLPPILAAAQEQTALEPGFWPRHQDAEERVRARLERDLAQPERAAWFLAEREGEVRGAVSVGLVPAPPVYRDLLAGLIGDVLFDADPDTLPLLLEAAEHFLRDGGAVVLVAACPARADERLARLEACGYRPLTLWMTRPLDAPADRPSSVRPATEADLPALVRLNAAAQEDKRRANPRFWTPHPEASRRFGGWMRRSLTLPDRDVLVHEGAGGVDGFVVAQPAGSPPAHDPGGIGLIDDFHTDDWAIFPALLNAGLHAFYKRGKHTVQIVCPAAWTERAEALEAAGFRTANLWLLKD